MKIRNYGWSVESGIRRTLQWIHKPPELSGLKVNYYRTWKEMRWLFAMLVARDHRDFAVRSDSEISLIEVSADLRRLAGQLRVRAVQLPEDASMPKLWSLNVWTTTFEAGLTFSQNCSQYGYIRVESCRGKVILFWYNFMRPFQE